MLLASITDGTAGDQAVNRDSRIQPLLTFVISSLHLTLLTSYRAYILTLSHCIRIPSYSRSQRRFRSFFSHSFTHTIHIFTVIYIIFHTIFPFSRFLFFQINIIIMNPRYEYVAPLFLSAASNVFLFFIISKCNRDLYKNVHLLRLIVIIFII